MTLLILEAILAYFINLASGERSAAITESRARKLKDAIEQEETLKTTLASLRPIQDEVRLTCIKLAQARTQFGVTSKEEPIWRLLSDDVFQADIAEWLMAGAMEEGHAAKDRLLNTMELALSSAGGAPEQIAFLRSGYFDSLEKAVFANPILARWRHQLSLDYLRQQVTVLRQHAEEAAGVFSLERQQKAIDCYCDKSLASWDIIDLSNLPEGDIHMATQKLLLRQLYMPLRIEVERAKQGEDYEAVLARIEAERDARRHREAGHLLVDRPDHQKSRVAVGERLGESGRLVVLGDPGGGKTTMLRWMATAYLLRHNGDNAFNQIPDTQSLPGKAWIPVLIRCRDLGEADLCRCFADFLTQHLNKTELLPAEAEVMRAVILDRIAKGEALLLVDGLDEITNPQVRMMFCQELERTAVRYPNAPIVVTSRIVGYRDMPYRMGSGFEHGQIAELTRDDKDLFTKRWVEVTEQSQATEEKAKRVQELLDALHSNDRIERLTGNPMLLTTLALVKRKVGKLPNKRTKLYAEAVSVLLNWNPRHYQTIEEDEAIPQLEYLAYEMCQRGVQRLPEDEVLDLLDKLRVEYPNIRAIKRREAHIFLKHLEERSSILIKSGGIWQKNTQQEKPVWEFRHLTFQEYLAARALLDGRYPGRDKSKSLAQQVAPLAGPIRKSEAHGEISQEGELEVEVPEAWREALRLLMADCKDDDVDDVALAILNPMPGEDASKATRPRAVLAAQCLADEPNIDEETGLEILRTLASKISEDDGLGHMASAIDRAAAEVGSSLWAPSLKKMLMADYLQRPPQERQHVGGVWGVTENSRRKRLGIIEKDFFEGLVQRLRSGDQIEAISAALSVMQAAFEEDLALIPNVSDALFNVLEEPMPLADAAIWALFWMNGGRYNGDRKPLWNPTQSQAALLCDILPKISSKEVNAVYSLIHILGKTMKFSVANAVISKLDDPTSFIRQTASEALGRLGDKQAIVPLMAKLDDSDEEVVATTVISLYSLGEVHILSKRLSSERKEVRQAIVRAYALQRNEVDQQLLSCDFDALSPWLDTQAPLTEARVTDATANLKLTHEQVRSRYEAMEIDLNLKLDWKF